MFKKKKEYLEKVKFVMEEDSFILVFDLGFDFGLVTYA